MMSSVTAHTTAFLTRNKAPKRLKCPLMHFCIMGGEKVFTLKTIIEILGL